MANTKDSDKQYPVQYLILQGEDEWNKYMVGDEEENDCDIAVFIHRSVVKDMIKWVYKDYQTWMLGNLESINKDMHPLQAYSLHHTGHLMQGFKDKFSHILPEELGPRIAGDNRTSLSFWANLVTDAIGNLKNAMEKRDALSSIFDDDEEVQEEQPSSSKIAKFPTKEALLN